MKDRRTKKRVRLRKGEVERADGYYVYRWTAPDGKRHGVVAKTLDELRIREDEIQRDQLDGLKTITRDVTLNTIYLLWKKNKRGLKDNTLTNYCYMYELFVKDDLGQHRLREIRRSDVKAFYNKLVEQRGLKINTLEIIHNVLHQILQVAVDDNYIRQNPSDRILSELKRSSSYEEPHKRALTIQEQELFLNYLRKEGNSYHHWYPVFAVMVGTGMRVGEVTGLQWEDIDFEEGIINVNHTLVYYNHRQEVENAGCTFNVHSTKTEAGTRQIPMLPEVKEAFLMEKEYQELTDTHCTSSIDGYNDFIFVNRFGAVQHQGTLNKALRRIIRDCNQAQLDSGKENSVLLPNFSCHSLRHTFTTRLVEAGVNIKVIQNLCGHTRSDITLDIYTTVTKELKQREFGNFSEKMAQQRAELDKLNAANAVDSE